MPDVVLTGASRGIGRALALALATRPERLVLIARDAARLAEVAREVEARGGRAIVEPADLGSLSAARALGERLAARVAPGSTLVHNAGLWPSRRELGPDGLEGAFVVNHLAPLVLQDPLLAAGRVARILVVSAGLIAAGRFDAQRTPTGGDFSAFRTYATTKLALAVAMRDVAERHPEVDVLVLHPGVVRTDLGARPGLLGKLVDLAKRRWEAPEACAERLTRVLARGRWSPPGEACWQIEEEPRPWPAPARDAATQEAIRNATRAALART